MSLALKTVILSFLLNNFNKLPIRCCVCVLTSEQVLHMLFALENNPFQHFITFLVKNKKQTKKSKREKHIKEKKGIYQFFPGVH